MITISKKIATAPPMDAPTIIPFETPLPLPSAGFVLLLVAAGSPVPAPVVVDPVLTGVVLELRLPPC